MSPFELFTIWLSLFSVCFTFLPILVVLDWRRRGSADGFSSVNYVLPMLIDPVNIYLNLFNLVVFAGYVACFAYYQPVRKYLLGQLLGLVSSLYFIFQYVEGQRPEQKPETMAAIAAFTQIVGLFGGLYDIKRAISLKTTEYIPATIQWGILALTVQWTFFGVAIGNYYMAGANLAGLAVNLVTLGLYLVYPPRTWVVPIFGTGGTHKKKQ